MVEISFQISKNDVKMLSNHQNYGTLVFGYKIFENKKGTHFSLKIATGNSLKVKHSGPCFGSYLLGNILSYLTKFIQKIDPNSRMPRIFMDLVEKSAFYIYRVSNNKVHFLFSIVLEVRTFQNQFT